MWGIAMSEILFGILAEFSMIIILLLICGAYLGIRYGLNRLRYSDYGRALTMAEDQRVSAIASSIATKGTEHYPLSFTLIHWAGLPLFFIFIGMSGFAVALVYAQFRSDFIQTFPHDIYDLHAGVEFPASALIGAFTGMFLLGAVYVILGRLSDELRTFFVLKGWGTWTGQPREWVDYVSEVEHLVYTDKLDLNDYDSNQTVIDHIFERSSQKWLFCTSFMCVVTAVFLFLDVRSYSWIDTQENRVVQSPYFSLEQISYGPEDIEGVIRKCDLVSFDDGPSAHLEYIIIGPGGHRINLGHEPWKLLPFIKLVEAQLGEKVETKIDLPIALKGLPETNETCLANLKHDYEEEPELKAELWALYEF